MDIQKQHEDREGTGREQRTTEGGHSRGGRVDNSLDHCLRQRMVNSSPAAQPAEGSAGVKRGQESWDRQCWGDKCTWAQGTLEFCSRSNCTFIPRRLDAKRLTRGSGPQCHPNPSGTGTECQPPDAPGGFLALV